MHYEARKGLSPAVPAWRLFEGMRAGLLRPSSSLESARNGPIRTENRRPDKDGDNAKGTWSRNRAASIRLFSVKLPCTKLACSLTAAGRGRRRDRPASPNMPCPGDGVHTGSHPDVLTAILTLAILKSWWLSWRSDGYPGAVVRLSRLLRRGGGDSVASHARPPPDTAINAVLIRYVHRGREVAPRRPAERFTARRGDHQICRRLRSISRAATARHSSALLGTPPPAGLQGAVGRLSAGRTDGPCLRAGADAH